MAFGNISNIAVSAQSDANRLDAANFNQYQRMLQGGLQGLSKFEENKLRREKFESETKLQKKKLKLTDRQLEIAEAREKREGELEGLKLDTLKRVEKEREALKIALDEHDGDLMSALNSVPASMRLGIIDQYTKLVDAEATSAAYTWFKSLERGASQDGGAAIPEYETDADMVLRIVKEQQAKNKNKKR